MDDLVKMNSVCTEWKTNAAPVAIERNWRFWEDAIRMAHQLWRWELAKLTGFPAQSDDTVFTDAWMARQTKFDRLRGWLSAAKRLGWYRSWKYGRRWARHARKASPRYWIYAAAGECLFSLPDILRKNGPTPDWNRLLDYLPLRTPSPCKPDWRQVAAEIYSNYTKLLVDTRA
jgi:hypothetical protein